jgi:hypothetical protein
MSTVFPLLTYAHALERRYRGVTVNVDRLEDVPHWKDYTGWRIIFRASKDELIRHGIVTAEDIAKAYSRRHKRTMPPDAFGHSRGISCQDDGSACLWVHVPDYIPEDHDSERCANTRKIQRQVSKLLKRAFRLPRQRRRS